MTPDSTFYVFRIHHHGKETHRRVLAKFHLENGQFTLLENHGVFPPDIESRSPAEASKLVENLTRSMYFEVVNAKELVQGFHPHLLKEVKSNGGDIRQVVAGNETAPPPTGEFEYDRVGGEGPRQLVVHDGKVFLDGQELSSTEVLRVKDHVKTGKAYLRTKLQKGESIFNPGMAPHERDSTVPGAGNLYSYNQFLKNAPPGLHVHINLHDIAHLNNTHGHQVGNDAIAAMGKGIKKTADELVGRNSRVFRLGGDNFAVHVPSAEAAALFARGLRQHFESIPAVKGSHSFAASIGVGADPDSAKLALTQAKSEKASKKYPPGKSKTHVVMSLPSLRGSF